MECPRPDLNLTAVQARFTQRKHNKEAALLSKGTCVDERIFAQQSDCRKQKKKHWSNSSTTTGTVIPSGPRSPRHKTSRLLIIRILAPRAAGTSLPTTQKIYTA
ncbi:unnamed protein product [Ectocarpus sp. 8 AP-2014]